MSSPTERSSFDAYAANYDKDLARGIAVSGEDKIYFARGRVAWLARCLNELGVRPRRVLDFGCGTGTATPFFFELIGAESVVGVDVSEQSLAVAREFRGSARAQFCLKKDYEPRGDFDLAFCNGVFHHIPLAGRAEAAQYIWRSLKPSGLFAMWENNGWHLGARYVMWRIPFDREADPLCPPAARRLVLDAGFTYIHTTYSFVFPRVLCWFRRFEPALARWPFGAQYQVLAKRNIG